MDLTWQLTEPSMQHRLVSGPGMEKDESGTEPASGSGLLVRVSMRLLGTRLQLTHTHRFSFRRRVGLGDGGGGTSGKGLGDGRGEKSVGFGNHPAGIRYWNRLITGLPQAKAVEPGGLDAAGQSAPRAEIQP
jgi:hypothetical protein